MVAHVQVLALEVLPGAVVAKADEHLVLIAERRRGGEVDRAGQHAPIAVGSAGKEEDIRVRDMAFDHPDLEAAVADALEDVVAAQCGQAPEYAVDLLNGGGLERDDGCNVAHHARVVETGGEVRAIGRGAGGVIVEHPLAARGVERAEQSVEDLTAFGGGDAGVADEAHSWRRCSRKTLHRRILSQGENFGVVGTRIQPIRGCGPVCGRVTTNT